MTLTNAACVNKDDEDDDATEEGKENEIFLFSHLRVSTSNSHFLGILPNHIRKVDSSTRLNWIVKVKQFDFVVKHIDCACDGVHPDVLCIVDSLVPLHSSQVVFQLSLFCKLICPLL